MYISFALGAWLNIGKSFYIATINIFNYVLIYICQKVREMGNFVLVQENVNEIG